MGQSPFWETNGCSGTQKISRTLWTLTVHCRFLDSPSVVSILDLVNSSHFCNLPCTLSQHPLMVAGHYWRTIRVPAANDHICRPSCLSATWGHAVLWRGHNELHQTKRNVYINNCIFLRKTSHMKVWLIMNEALTFSLQTVELPRQQVVVSQAFSDMLSGRIRSFLVACSHCGIQSINKY